MTKARPFLKWAGGKRQLMPELLKRTPERFLKYYEPFMGGAALFFELSPSAAVLADANLWLVTTYRAVRDDVHGIIRRLTFYQNTVSFFEEMRSSDPHAMKSETEIAAWFIYLNKTAFNGLWRVNKRGKFNVPFGAYRNPTICDPDNLLACSRALRGAAIIHGDFESTTALAKVEDFVYFDPPYVPASKTASFTSYTKEGFGADEQRRLCGWARELKSRGVRVMLSNAAHEDMRQLYREGFTVETVSATRRISCKGSGRGPVGELLIT